MKKSVFRCSAVLAAAGIGVLATAGTAWACLGIAGLTTNVSHVQPGGRLGVTLQEFGMTPAQIHLNSPTGPLLATIARPGKGMTGDTSVNITIPANTPVGQHVLIATEPGNGMLAGIPARAVIQVGNGSAPATQAARPVAVTTNSGIATDELVGIGVGVAAVGLALAGGLSLATSRRRAGTVEAVKSN